MPIRRSPATFLARSAVSARRRGEPSLGGRLKADRVAALIAAAGAGLVGDADLEAGVDVFGIGELTAGTDDFAQNQRSPSPPPARRSSSGSSRSGYICQEQDPVGCVPVLWCAVNIGGGSGIWCRPYAPIDVATCCTSCSPGFAIDGGACPPGATATCAGMPDRLDCPTCCYAGTPPSNRAGCVVYDGGRD